MPWDDALERLMEMRSDRVEIRIVMSMAAAIDAAMRMQAATTRILRDVNHPRYAFNDAPRSPKPRIRKGRR